MTKFPLSQVFSSGTTAKGKGLEESAVGGSQRFMVMSALLTTETQKIQSGGFVTRPEGT